MAIFIEQEGRSQIPELKVIYANSANTERPLALQLNPIFRYSAISYLSNAQFGVLGHRIATLVARQNPHYNNSELISKIAKQTSSLDKESTKRTGRALSKLIARLREHENPSSAVNRYIATVMNPNNYGP